MFSFGQPGVRQFGGVGAMIDRPGVVVRVSGGAEAFRAAGFNPARVERIVQQVAAASGWEKLPRCTVEVVAAPPEHAGLGLGTTLALAVAAGLTRLQEGQVGDAAELAPLAGRGVRSAVGSYGFQHGGLIIEGGKFAGDALSPLVAQIALPAAWRFVLLRPPTTAGLSGAQEQQAFTALPGVPHDVTERLCAEALLHMAPAARESRFDEFGASLYRYGHLAGMCFAGVQGGPYASSQLQQLVHLLRDRGIEGVGQSSWGPTLFALVPDQSQAEALVADLQQQPETRDCDLQIAAPQNRGATIEVSEG